MQCLEYLEAAGDRGQGGSQDRPQRALLPQLSLWSGAGAWHALPHLHASSPAHFAGKDSEAQTVGPLPKTTQQSWNQKPQGSLGAKDFSGAPWDAWTVLMPQTGSVGRGLKPVKVQLVGGELAAGRWGREVGGPGDSMPVPGVAGAHRQRRVRDGHTVSHHPMDRTCSVPDHLALGQACKLSGVGVEHMLCVPEEIATPCTRAPHSAVLQQEPLWYQETKPSHPCSHNEQQEKEGTERVHNLPRVTQQSTAGRGLFTKQLRFEGLLPEAQGSL